MNYVDLAEYRQQPKEHDKMPAIVIDGAWTMKAKFTASGRAWTNSIDIMHGSADNVAPLATDDIAVSFVNWLPPNTDPGTTIVEVQLFKKRAGKGQLPILETLPLWTIPLNEPGTSQASYGDSGATTLMDFQVVAYCKRVAAGRPGRMFIRSLLREGDVTAAPGNVWIFNGGAGYITPASFHAQVAAHLSSHFGPITDVNAYYFAVVHIREDNLGAVVSQAIAPQTDLVLEYAGWFKRKR